MAKYLKNKQTFILIAVLIFGFVSGAILTKTDMAGKLSKFFKSGKGSLSQTIDSSFRNLPDQEQLKFLREIGKKEGSSAVLAFLRRIYPDEPADEHELAHVAGEAGFLEEGYAGFDVCDSFMRFACYHGVILEAIKQNGYNQEVLKDLGQGCLDLKRNKTTITACVHGIGHGLMVVKSYDLLFSYEACDKVFSDQMDLFFCYDGVSMENVVRRFEQADAENFLESKDPYYPCNTIPEKYQPACVREHLHHVRRVFYEKDTVKSQAYCLYFKNPVSRSECFGALGGAINQDYSDSPETVIAECGKVKAEYKENCFGVAATQYSFGRQFDKAAMVCNALGEPQRSGCMGSVENAKVSLN